MDPDQPLTFLGGLSASAFMRRHWQRKPLLVRNALPGALAQAFASHMAPGDPSGETLRVRIDSIYLGGGGPAGLGVRSGSAALRSSSSLFATSPNPWH